MNSCELRREATENVSAKLCLLKREFGDPNSPLKISLGCGPLTVTVTTRIIPFLVGNPYKPSFPTGTVRGPHPRYHLKSSGCVSNSPSRRKIFTTSHQLRTNYMRKWSYGEPRFRTSHLAASADWHWLHMTSNRTATCNALLPQNVFFAEIFRGICVVLSPLSACLQSLFTCFG